MNKLVKRLLTGTLAFATILTALPVTAVHASGNQYWTESAERVGYIEHVMNDGSIKSTFNEGHMKVEGETAYCVDINTSFKNGYKTRSDASTRMSSDQIADVALSLEYVKQYTASHTNLNYKQGYLLEQCVVWQRLSEQLGWQCDNVRASYNEIPQAVQNEVYAGAKVFVKLSTREERIKLAYENEVDTLEEYKENKKRLKAVRVDLEQQLLSLDTNTTSVAIPSKEDVLNKVRTVYDVIRDDTVDYETKGFFMRSLVEDIVYDKKNGKMIFTLYIS